MTSVIAPWFVRVHCPELKVSVAFESGGGLRRRLFDECDALGDALSVKSMMSDIRDELARKSASTNGVDSGSVRDSGVSV